MVSTEADAEMVEVLAYLLKIVEKANAKIVAYVLTVSYEADAEIMEEVAYVNMVVEKVMEVQY